MNFLTLELKHAEQTVIQVEHIVRMSPAIATGTRIRFVDGSEIDVVESIAWILKCINAPKDNHASN